MAVQSLGYLGTVGELVPLCCPRITYPAATPRETAQTSLKRGTFSDWQWGKDLNAKTAVFRDTQGGPARYEQDC